MLPDLSADDIRQFKIFHPEALRRTAAAVASRSRFVHYTTADAALKILRSKEVWLRKPACMNDYMETEHGFDCLREAYRKYKVEFDDSFGRLFGGFSAEMEKYFNDWLPYLRNDCFIACISEHESSEDELGRLSMWRAYGGKAGIAVVLNGEPFLQSSDALGAYTYPVIYTEKLAFEKGYKDFLWRAAEEADFLRSLGRDTVFARVYQYFRTSVLCSKHQGFVEEREWRIIYQPSLEKSKYILPGVESIGGVPQKICKVPLKSVPEEGFIGMDIPTLVERVIVGPSENPSAIREAFISLLEDAGVTDSAQKVVFSDIPLRT